MLENENTSTASPANRSDSQKIVDKLVFAALKEQTRARRWRIFYMLFFMTYLTVITVMLMSGSSGSISESDGEKHTAVVQLTGVIGAGEAAAAKNVISGIKAAFKHSDTAAIVLEINSPGGSPVQSAYIFDEIRRLKQKNENVPIYAVVSDIAASGAYFVAAATDKIYVNQSSLVGSIGVRMDSFGFVDLMKNLGIERRLLVAGDNKGLLDPFLPEHAEQKAHLQTMLDEVHQHFINSVKTGRGDRLQETEDLFSGLVWSGEKAIALGLVDDYGTTRSIARELEAETIVDFTPKTEFIDRVADRLGASFGKALASSLSDNIKLH
ncbi:MAG: S49 family peptidase [Pseudomonadota bacterium]